MDSSGTTEDNIRVIARIRPTTTVSLQNQSKQCITIPSNNVLIAGGSTYAFDSIASSNTTQVRILIKN